MRIIFTFLLIMASALTALSQNYSADLLKRAQKDDRVAQYQLAVALIEGKGITKDTAKGKEWLEKSARQGYVPAQSYLAEIYYFGFNDYDQAFRWWEQASRGGDLEALYNIACMYADGIGVKKNIVTANELLMKGAEKGNLNCIYNLANHYKKGLGVKQDDKMAISLYEKAAAKNHPGALYNLGIVYFNGEGVPRDRDKASDYFIAAADNGYIYALFALGESFYKGLEITRNQVDYNRAYKYMSRFIEQAPYYDIDNEMYGIAYQLLSKCLRFGRGVAANEELADEYLQKADAYGDMDSDKMLKVLGFK